MMSGRTRELHTPNERESRWRIWDQRSRERLGALVRGATDPRLGLPGASVRVVEAAVRSAEALDDHILVREHHHEGAFLG